MRVVTILTSLHLSDMIDKLEAKIPAVNMIQPSVSEVNVGWHIAHSLLVIIKIIQTIKNSEPTSYQWRFNKHRALFFLFKSFPRGIAKAPASVIPFGNEITTESLHESIKKVRISIDSLQTMQANQYFTHPFFGKLNIKSTQKFFAIHSLHHLKIINDILRY